LSHSPITMLDYHIICFSGLSNNAAATPGGFRKSASFFKSYQLQ